MSDVPGRLLRETLQSQMDESADCLDAETLAAWADGALSRRERGAVEAHAAGCARCQAMLAAMARTAPPPVSRVWWRSPLGWMVPVTAAAAALLVWFELPQSARAPAPQRAAAEISVASPSPSAPTPPQNRDERKARADKDKDRNLEADKIASPRQEKAEKEVFDKLAKSEPKPDAAPVEQPPAARSREAAAGSAAPAAPQAAAPAAAPPASAPAAPPRLASSAEAQASKTLGLQDASAAQARNMFEARRQLSDVTILSPNANSRWRITLAGDVQHSTDGGSTWETQATGAPAAPTAGVSPSPSVCWLVGPRGLVLLSTDGRSWKRIAFPELTDLTTVRSADDKTATVTTADGRMFTTRDGGATWRQ